MPASLSGLSQPGNARLCGRDRDRQRCAGPGHPQKPAAVGCDLFGRRAVLPGRGLVRGGRWAGRKKPLMAYTGYTFEQLLALPDPWVRELLGRLTLLVDGPYVQAERGLELKFRGSANQRVLDVPSSLAPARRSGAKNTDRDLLSKIGRRACVRPRKMAGAACRDTGEAAGLRVGSVFSMERSAGSMQTPRDRMLRRAERQQARYLRRPWRAAGWPGRSRCRTGHGRR